MIFPDPRFRDFTIGPPPAEMVSRMADDLVRREVFGSEADAIRALMGRYTYGELVAFAGDALLEAQRRRRISRQ